MKNSILEMNIQPNPRKCYYCLVQFPSTTKFHRHMPCPNLPKEERSIRRLWSRNKFRGP